MKEIKLKTNLSILPILFVLIVACKKPVDIDEGGNGKIKSASGKVVDSRGVPIKDVKVVIVNNYPGYHETLIGHTNAQGNYEIKLPEIGTFYASAEMKQLFNDKEYLIRMHSENNSVFGPEGGAQAVRNFKWILGGVVEGSTLGYYGGAIGIHADFGSLIDPENVEFTLTPVGKLIDGSNGQTLKLKGGAPFTEFYGKLIGIPIGIYDVSAVNVANQQQLRLKIKDSTNELATKVRISFQPNTLTGENMAYLIFSE